MELSVIHSQLCEAHQQAGDAHHRMRVEVEKLAHAMWQAEAKYRLESTESALAILNEKKAAFDKLSAERVSKWKEFIKLGELVDLVWKEMNRQKKHQKAVG